MIEYDKYEVKDFITDERFRDWVLNSTDELDSFWSSWLSRYPEKSHTILQAKSFILSIRYNEVAYDKQKKSQLLERILEESQQPRQLNFKKIGFRRILGVAASIILLIGISSLLFFLQLNTQNKVPTEVVEAPLVERTTSNGEKLKLRLSDGTVVKLNAGTSIRFPSHLDSLREVFMDGGEAFFDVSHDSLHPFIVHVGDVTVKVLGTSFNVNSSEKNTKVALVSGKVEVWNVATDTLLLAPNQLASFDSISAKISAFNYEQEVGWKDGVLSFYKADLPEIAQKIEQWYGCNVILDTNKALQRKFTGSFKNLSLERALEGIAYTSNITYKIEKKTVTISLK